MIYFITAREIGRVKIGFSDNPRARLGKMRVDCPLPLELERVCAGSEVDEADLHARFSAYRMNGEWFTLSLEIERFMRTLDEPETGRRRIGHTSLGEWIVENGHTLATFAALVGTNVATISRICNGKQYPMRDLLVRIIEATDWALSADEILLIPAKPSEERAA